MIDKLCGTSPIIKTYVLGDIIPVLDADSLNYNDHGFKVFRNVIDGPALKIVQEMVLHQLKEVIQYDQVPYDPQVPYRIPLGRCSVGEAVLHQLQHLIEQESGVEILPTYAYPTLYRPGSVLRRHIDRDACEFTATFTVLNQPETYSWPIYAESGEKQDIRVDMNPGDLCFYDGRNCDHWRDQIADGCYNISIFLHYVTKKGNFEQWHEREQRNDYNVDNLSELLNNADAVGDANVKNPPKRFRKS